MKKLLYLLICMMSTLAVHAKHIIGGQVYYTFLQQEANGNYTYRVTLRLYRTCESGQNIAEMPVSAYLTTYNNDSPGSVAYTNPLVSQSSFEQKELAQFDPCIVNPPRVCFQVAYYTTTITVAPNDKGYTVAFQSCCRDNFMVNIIAENMNGPAGNQGTGATYFTELPGRLNGIPENSSPQFNKEEATLVCAGKKFTYDFSASDQDNDELTYSFCSAFKGGRATNNTGIPDPAVPPPYDYVNYVSPFSGASPLGPSVTIDSKTGIISGIAPDPGKYVVTVCVEERRNGKLVGTLRKDFHINVTTCVKQVVAAMPDKYAECRSMTVTFLNNSTLGKPYHWDFGDGTTLDTNDPAPLPHTYTTPGVYTVKLYVDKSSNCGDSATAKVFVFPVFNTDFITAGRCVDKPVQFTDRSRTDMGTLAYYKWDFGTGIAADSSNLRNPQFTYTRTGNYQVIMYARTSFGCEQFDTTTISVYDHPPLYTTADTVICVNDSLRLNATSDVPGTFTWQPATYRIFDENTPTPTVFPLVDTFYTVYFTDQEQCVAEKRVAIDVRQEIHVNAMSDSTVCTGDEIRLYASSDGPFGYIWTELSSNTVVGNDLQTIVTPQPPLQQYEIHAQLGKCHDRDTVGLKVVDPPRAAALPDSTICSGSKVLLRASGGAYYTWSPSYYVENPRSAVTWARPTDTTLFTVTVTDTLGCPREVTATALVKVVPPVQAFAGNDTIVMLGTPFQLHATGGVRYTWSPSSGLSSTTTATPFAAYDKDITYTVTAYTQEGCSGTDDIFVRFFTGPEIYIPNAFSPNGDGKNDIFRPLPVGIVQMNYFRVYDRWGKLMYSSTAYLKGWDGTVNGQRAPVGTYVWMVEGVDINQKTISLKGTVTIVR
ncbi:PKD domain-containing protein [Chitinophaga sp. sic0106]|uniref:PKD domain-containing protein n=1 Tax=Chitinophaga sp. sic0106 TaxID=2854785 RepID=UPI001C48E55B|nr:gliding motility-associated C-terminal domain-containing protein [Chitinophaga sp. sic0106]